MPATHRFHQDGKTVEVTYERTFVDPGAPSVMSMMSGQPVLWKEAQKASPPIWEISEGYYYHGTLNPVVNLEHVKGHRGMAPIVQQRAMKWVERTSKAPKLAPHFIIEQPVQKQAVTGAVYTQRPSDPVNPRSIDSEDAFLAAGGKKV